MTICAPDGSMTSCRDKNFNIQLNVKTGKTKFSATDSTGPYQFEIKHFKLYTKKNYKL